MFSAIRKNSVIRDVYSVALLGADNKAGIAIEVCIYFILSPYILLLKRPKALVKLYCSRFGHLLSNTEFFFSDAEFKRQDLSGYFYFAMSKHVDSPELVRLIERAHGVKVLKGIYARAVFATWTVMGVPKIDISALSEPENVPYKSKIGQMIARAALDKPYVTLSLRNGKYSQTIQGATESSAWRDTDINCLTPSIIQLIREGYDVYLVNKNHFDRKLLEDIGVKNCEYKGVEHSMSLMKGAKFHIDTSTGTSLAAAFLNTLQINLNCFFAGSLNTKCYTNGNVSFQLPMKLYNELTGKFCTVVETVDFIQKMQQDLGQSTIYSEGYMRAARFHWIQNKASDISVAIDEAKNFADRPQPANELQQSFWESYPSKWVNIAHPAVVYHDSILHSDLRISTVYLEQHLK